MASGVRPLLFNPPPHFGTRRLYPLGEKCILVYFIVLLWPYNTSVRPHMVQRLP
ncbi:uncharacterized protein ACLA_044580 [Aspergillus clavatus NRRL 1]|uniref:Uncharacterized protein n=1 Tax=Aspergillus clavatus (strain ATCC 1007 / CBS 513.65 / DSM 816 / NCTC 3887 / NRRL 1 / QM 1276 / 107) TaxID=344612 RepID=A1C8V1_ASPCL|nr:uncharacterized protein ACLA_044580 [Aspergillus clavatus NRRL 1]EAW13738.1 hypothetical protein ACLA_044580 [Aspergillus clavatus NRRL 1]